MTNSEKFKDKIWGIITSFGSNFGMADGKVGSCLETACPKCNFCKGITCNEERIKWLNAEYVEPTTDWSKVPVDTKVYVGEGKDIVAIPRHFAKYENGKVYVWTKGGTSWTNTVDECVSWLYAKLADEVE